MYAAVAEVGVSGQRVVPIRGGDRDNVGKVVAGGETDGRVIIQAFIAGRGHEEHSLILGTADGVVKGLREAAPTPGVTQDLDALAQGIVDALDRVGCGAAATANEFQGHEFDIPGHASNSGFIVAHRADGPGHVGAVPVVVHGVAGVGYGIDAEHVVDKAVFVVVDSVVGNFAGVGPHVGGEIGMVVVDAGVDYTDDNGGGAGAEAPGFGGVDVCVYGSTGLPGIVEAPQLVE